MISARRVVLVLHHFETGARRSSFASVQVPRLGVGRGSSLLGEMLAKVGVGLLRLGELEAKRFFGEEVAEVRRSITEVSFCARWKDCERSIHPTPAPALREDRQRSLNELHAGRERWGELTAFR